MDNKTLSLQWDIAKQYFSQSKFQEANAIYEEIEPVATIIYEDFYLFLAMFYGDYFSNLLNIDINKAQIFSEKALFYKNLEDKKELRTTELNFINYNMGLLKYRQNKIDEAIIWYQECIDTYESRVLWTGREEIIYFDACNNLGGIYYNHFSDYEKAKYYFLKTNDGTNKYPYFEPFYFLSKIFGQENNKNLSNKYHKMLITRLKKTAYEDLLDSIQDYCESDKVAIKQLYDNVNSTK